MFPELFSAAGKTALITGGTRGIGYMIAEQMYTKPIEQLAVASALDRIGARRIF
jgi:NAD(P)-dependent dehydrogenase (short-subunit alcohol dehydrogenase family)